MAAGAEHVLYFVSTGEESEDPVDNAAFVSETPEPAFAYIEANGLGFTHEVFQITTTANLLTIWTGE